MKLLGRDEARAYGLRGGSKFKAQHLHCIEGSYCTTIEIAARLGVTERTALKRLAAARKSPHPVTWAVLGCG